MNKIMRIDEFFKQYPVVVVVFKKADGTMRRLRCTTQDIPAKYNTTTKAKESDTTKTVFDLDKQAWRSFRIDSVISMKAGE